MKKNIVVFLLAILWLSPILVLAADCPGVPGGPTAIPVPNGANVTCPNPANIGAVACVGTGCEIGANAGRIDINPGGGFGNNTKDFLTTLIGRITQYLFYAALVIAPLIALFGGVTILTAAGDPKKVDKGKNLIIWSAIGLGIFLLAKVIGNVITTAFWPAE